MSSTDRPRHIRVGVVLFPDALPLDFIGEQHVTPERTPAGPPIGTFKLIRSPTCLLNALSPSRLTATSSPLISSSSPAERTRATFECIHLAESLEPVRCSGTTITPDKTFAAVQQAFDSGGDAGDKIDVMLLPGGFGARPWNASEGLKGFVKWAAEHVETTLTVCTGSWLLASTGALQGQQATTNKKAFNECREYFEGKGEPFEIDWISHARWVKSGRFFTASGVSAGMDMACAYIDEVAGEAGGQEARAYAEYTSNSQGDDPWAAASGLT